MTDKLKTASLILALLLIYGLVGRWDMEAAQADEARYLCPAATQEQQP